MAKINVELFDSEWAILQAVWEHEPCAAPTVQEALQEEKGWAYTTVKTLMDRMVKKGLLQTERIRNLYLYRAAITRAQAQRMRDHEDGQAGVRRGADPDDAVPDRE